MIHLRLSIALLLALSSAVSTTRAVADSPPAAEIDDEAAGPVLEQSNSAGLDTQPSDEQGDLAEGDDGSDEQPADEPEADAEAADIPNAGLEDLDSATQLKVTAESLPDLNDVVDKLDSAIEKGLDKDNQAFAEELLVSALIQRATVLSAVVLDRPLADPRRDPRWMQVRQFAMNDLQRALSLDDEVWEAQLLVGRLQSLPMGDDKSAKRALTEVIDAPAADLEQRAQAFALRGALQTDSKKRAADFDEAVKLVPDRPDYYRIRAQYLYSQDKFKEALADVDKALEMDPEQPATQELRGLILLGLNQLEDALATFNKASELAPEAALPYQHRGEVYRRQGDLKKAVEQLGKALELAPGDVATLLLRAHLRYQMEDTDGAIKDVDSVIQSQPQLLLAHLLKAEIFAATGRVDEAVEQLERLLPHAPVQARLLDPLARYYLIAGRPRKSIETFDKLIKIEPENFTALRYRGDAYLNIGNHEKAVVDFDAALETNQDDDGLLNNFAWVLATSPDDKVRSGKRAIELATKAAELTSYTVPHILSTLAAAHAETGNFDEAKKWSQKAIDTCSNELKLAKTDDDRKRLNADLENLTKELKSFQADKPIRERQEQVEKPSPSANDQTFAPASAAPAPARTLDF